MLVVGVFFQVFANAVYTNQVQTQSDVDTSKLSGQVSKLETDLDKLEASLSGVSSTEITQIKADIAQLKIDVAAAAAAAAASSSSGGASSSSTDLTAISAQVATNTNDISTLDTKRQANEVKINDNVSKVSKLCDRVSYIYGNLTDAMLCTIHQVSFLNKNI